VAAGWLALVMGEINCRESHSIIGRLLCNCPPLDSRPIIRMLKSIYISISKTTVRTNVSTSEEAEQINKTAKFPKV
jgi:hypothetical protein